MAKIPTQNKTVETILHEESKRKNIPTAEHQSVIKQNEKNSIQIKYPRNTDLDPQLVWRGKDEQDWNDLVVNAPPLYIQEKVHPKALIDDLLRQSKKEEHNAGMNTADLFADFDGIPKDVDKTEFYTHDQNWSNRMILGDSLQVMASLAEREGLRGQVQCIYFDPPYGIKFNSNFQWSTTSRDVKDGKSDHITREPEQVKAFRDTWRDGIHSYLTYLRDRLTVARDLLNESGSIFVQIGDENVHRVRALLDEVFGDVNFVNQISVLKTTGVMASTSGLNTGLDIILWYRKSENMKYREIFQSRSEANASSFNKVMLPNGEVAKDSKKIGRKFRFADLLKQGPGSKYEFECEGKLFDAGKKWWGTTKESMERCVKANRVKPSGNFVYFVSYEDDFKIQRISNLWTDTTYIGDRFYVVQTGAKIIERCFLMASDPGDLILDPTCGSGTSAYVAEQWGRRWITIDTSRVALALARSRIMGAKYPFYLLSDSPEGVLKEAEITHNAPSNKISTNQIKYGFVYERVPHISLKSVAHNIEVDVIYNRFNSQFTELLNKFNEMLNGKFTRHNFPTDINESWSSELKNTFINWWDISEKYQKEIDESISAKAEYEFLYDKPYQEKKKVRVSGPFTVESLSPHRALEVDENDNLKETLNDQEETPKQSFTQMIIDNLKTSGVQQAHKEDKIEFSMITMWPGKLICAEGKYYENKDTINLEKRAGIFIGPEFGTVQRADLVEAAKEAGDAGFDVLIACAFNYEAHATDLNKLGNIPILKARMNADLHMSEDLKNTGKGNLFVIFGEPDIEIIPENNEEIRIKINGVDIFKPQTGEVISDGAEGIACWFIDTDYNEESFFVRHAYFLGANDPYSSLKTTLKSEINLDAWETLNSDISRPFPKPKSGRIAVKVINHLGDEVMKVFKV